VEEEEHSGSLIVNEGAIADDGRNARPRSVIVTLDGLGAVRGFGITLLFDEDEEADAELVGGSNESRSIPSNNPSSSKSSTPPMTVSSTSSSSKSSLTTSALALEFLVFELEFADLRIGASKMS